MLSLKILKMVCSPSHLDIFNTFPNIPGTYIICYKCQPSYLSSDIEYYSPVQDPCLLQ